MPGVARNATTTGVATTLLIGIGKYLPSALSDEKFDGISTQTANEFR